MVQEIALGNVNDARPMSRIVQEAFKSPWSMQMIRATLLNRNYEVRVIRGDDGGLHGFFIAHRVLSTSNLDVLAVNADVRGQGHGTRLLDLWIQDSIDNNMRGLTLQVNADNARAIDLYQANQFIKTRLLESYYPNGDSAYEMKRRIGKSATETAD